MADDTDQRVDLVRGNFDVLVQFRPPPESGYISRRLGNAHILLVASPSYLDRHGVPLTIDDLHHHKCISLGSSLGEPYLWALGEDSEAHWRDDTVVFKPTGQCFITGNLDAAINAAVHGCGIAPIDIGAALST